MTATTERGQTPKRRFRLNLRRVVLLAGLTYVVVGSVFSAQHLLGLLRQQQQLAVQIAVVKHETAILHGDLAELHNPATLKLMLTGKRRLPSDVLTTPSTFP